MLKRVLVVSVFCSALLSGGVADSYPTVQEIVIGPQAGSGCVATSGGADNTACVQAAFTAALKYLNAKVIFAPQVYPYVIDGSISITWGTTPSVGSGFSVDARGASFILNDSAGTTSFVLSAPATTGDNQLNIDWAGGYYYCTNGSAALCPSAFSGSFLGGATFHDMRFGQMGGCAIYSTHGFKVDIVNVLGESGNEGVCRVWDRDTLTGNVNFNSMIGWGIDILGDGVGGQTGSNKVLNSETFNNGPVGTSATVTITHATPAVVSWTTAPAIGTAVSFATTGTLPAPLVAGAPYYVISAGHGTNSFEISSTSGGSAINTSTGGSGTHTGTTLNGYGASYTATISGGAVTGFTKVSGGSGYVAGTAIVHLIGGSSNGSGGNNAVATANVTNGAISSLTLVSGGGLYTSAPIVEIDQGGGIYLAGGYIDDLENPISESNNGYNLLTDSEQYLHGAHWKLESPGKSGGYGQSLASFANAAANSSWQVHDVHVQSECNLYNVDNGQLTDWYADQAIYSVSGSVFDFEGPQRNQLTNFNTRNSANITYGLELNGPTSTSTQPVAANQYETGNFVLGGIFDLPGLSGESAVNRAGNGSTITSSNDKVTNITVVYAGGGAGVSGGNSSWVTNGGFVNSEFGDNHVLINNAIGGATSAQGETYTDKWIAGIHYGTAVPFATGTSSTTTPVSTNMTTAIPSGYIVVGEGTAFVDLTFMSSMGTTNANGVSCKSELLAAQSGYVASLTEVPAGGSGTTCALSTNSIVLTSASLSLPYRVWITDVKIGDQ